VTSRWNDWSLLRKSLVVGLVPFLAIVVSTGVLWSTNRREQDAQRSLDATTAVAAAVRPVSALFAGAQSDLGGYGATRRHSDLVAYRRQALAVSRAVGALEALAHRTGLPPGAASALRSLEASTTTSLAELSAVAASLATVATAPGPVSATPGPATSATTTTTPTGRALGTIAGAGRPVEAAAAVALSDLNRQVETDEAAVTALQRDVSDTTLATLATAAVAIGLAAAFFAISISRRLSALALAIAGVAQVGEGNALGEVPQGRDEIGRIGEAFVRAIETTRSSERVLREAISFMEAIFENGPVVAMRFERATGALTYASPNVASLLGYDREGIVASPESFRGRFSDAALTTEDRFLLRGEGAGRSERVECSYHHPDGTDRRVIATLDVHEVLSDGSDFTCFIMDRTGQHDAEEARDRDLRRLQSILDAAPVLFVIGDDRDRAVELMGPVDEVFERLFGRPLAPGERSAVLEHLNSPDALPFDAEDNRRLRTIIHEVRTAGRPTDTTSAGTSLQIRATAFDGTPRFFETRVRPLHDSTGKVVGTVTGSWDVSARVGLEQALVEARDEAVRANQAKSEFLSRMSHELRTPLNAVLGFAQLLAMDALPAESVESVEFIQRAGKHLLELVNDVLDLSRIEAGTIRMAVGPVVVADVVTEVVALMRPSAALAGISIHWDPDAAAGLTVRADHQRLLQAVLNLVGNGVKYNLPLGSVTVDVGLTGDGAAGPTGDRTAPGGDSVVRLAVRDTGIGIEPDAIDRLFVPFERLGAEHSGVEGTGVGLALSRRLVEMMGGTIGVESTPGKGSTFWIDLPAASEWSPDHDTTSGPGQPAGRAASDRRSSRSARGSHDRRVATVLHIEDNASNARLVSRVLARLPSLRLITASRGRLGIDLARQHHPDLILLDLHLPDLAGTEVLRQLRDHEPTADIPVVVVSADVTSLQVDAALAGGIVAYLTKPIDVDELYDLVCHYTGAAPAGDGAATSTNQPTGQQGPAPAPSGMEPPDR